MSWATWPNPGSLQLHTGRAIVRSASEAGARGFRDFPLLPAAKENRSVSRRTPLLRPELGVQRDLAFSAPFSSSTRRNPPSASGTNRRSFSS